MRSTVEAPRLDLTASLGIHGWAHLDPVLLVGRHGTAKSMLVERIAASLGLRFRHYNTSLLNYDDLVGIPLPEEGTDALRFAATPGAIWGAEFAFFDEIGRCRWDLQNKLFPIIHERRVAGVDLPDLRCCWGAMNPPGGFDTPGGAGYAGSVPLDPALADRFWYIVPVPDWPELTPEQRQAMVWAGDAGLPSRPDLQPWLDRCQDRIRALEPALLGQLTGYVVGLMDILGQAPLPQSPRWARRLARLAVAVHAAREILSGGPVDLATSAELALLNGVPQSASEAAPSPATLLAAHRQAWELVGLQQDAVWRSILAAGDPVSRVRLADVLAVGDDDLGRLVTAALGEIADEGCRMALATALFLAFSQRRPLTPAAWEVVTTLAAPVLTPAAVHGTVPRGAQTDLWQEILQWMSASAHRGSFRRLEKNFLLAGFPDLWSRNDWRQAVTALRGYLRTLGAEADAP